MTTGNEATRQHATRGMQQTPRRRRQTQTTHATDNVQQTADDMQEDASTCEMQHQLHSTAAFRVRRAAGSAQPAACAKHCTRQPVRNTADATHEMQHTTGAAACSNHTRNRHHAGGIETYEMRRTESGRSSHLEAAPGFLRSGLITARKEPPRSRCLRRSSPTLTHIVGMRASLAN